MSKNKNPPAVVQAEDNEALFLAALNARAEANRRGAELAQARLELMQSEITRAKEKRAAQDEMDGLVGFVSVIALLVIAAVCVFAAPIWAVCLPLAGMLAVMRKVGWL